MATVEDEHEQNGSEYRQKDKGLTNNSKDISQEGNAQSPPSQFKRHFNNDLVMITLENSPNKCQRR